MRPVWIGGLLIGLAATAGAQVNRCVDAAGKVSYSDDACPANAREAAQILSREAIRRDAEAASSRAAAAPPPVAPSPREPLDTTARSAQTPAQQQPGGPILLDHQAERKAEAERRALEQQRRDAELAEGDPWYPPRHADPRPPRDMRPRLQNCDASGCRDTQGNQYDRSGNLSRFTRPDGKTCQPIGTTVVCR